MKSKRRKKRIKVKRLFLCICCILLSLVVRTCIMKKIGTDTNNSILKNNDKLSKMELSLSGKKIVIDPGHGGKDSGTQGLLTGVYEADLNLEISNKLKDKLESMGAEVIMTRTEESTKELGDEKKLQTSLRGKIIEDAKADMLLSIHQNYNKDSKKVAGVQILYADKNSAQFADALQEEFNTELNRRLHNQKNEYIVLKLGNQIGVIVECGFLSNKEDEDRLQTDEYQSQVVDIICKQVEKYFSE